MAAFFVTLPLALMELEPMGWTADLYGAMAWSVLGLTIGGSSLLYLLIQRGAAASVASLMYLVPHQPHCSHGCCLTNRSRFSL
jgi:drug/metabolite transporter (DMT)-like permease